VVGKGSKIGQESKTKQGRGKSAGKKCSTPRGKCTAKRRRIIQRKRGTNNVKNGRGIQRRRQWKHN